MTHEWQALADGLRPRPPSLEELDPGTFDHGWQFFAARAVEERFSSSTIWPRLSPTEQALFRSQVVFPARLCQRQGVCSVLVGTSPSLGL